MLPVLGIVECLFGLFVGHDGPGVSGMKDVLWMKGVTRVGGVEGVA